MPSLMRCFPIESPERRMRRHVFRAWLRMSRGGYRLADQVAHLSQGAH
jgi:hypothetical protein